MRNAAAELDDEDRWIARGLPGGIYCSPRCGCGCTRAAFDQATKDSAALAARLGDGWEPSVWENCGWRWEVCKGPVINERFGGGGGGICVHRARDGSYQAEFRSALTGTNTVALFFAGAATAEDAIGHVRQDARTFISRLEADLAASI